MHAIKYAYEKFMCVYGLHFIIVTHTMKSMYSKTISLNINTHNIS